MLKPSSNINMLNDIQITFPKNYTFLENNYIFQ